MRSAAFNTRTARCIIIVRHDRQMPVNVLSQHPILARCARRLAVVIAAYLAWLLLLGPFWAVDGRWGVASERVRKVVWAPALWTRHAPVARLIVDAYLDNWYVDPDAPGTTE